MGRGDSRMVELVSYFFFPSIDLITYNDSRKVYDSVPDDDEDIPQDSVLGMIYSEVAQADAALRIT